MPETERREIVFWGRVQGVGFRATTRGICRSHGLTGWVRNEPDGSVRAQVQGDPASIDAALAELRETMAGLITGEHAGTITTESDEVDFRIAR
jgi:acylphosphatase